MPSIGVSIEWPSWIETSSACLLRSSSLIRKLQKLSSSTKQSKLRGVSAHRSRLSSSTASWTASKRNWKVNGFTRTDSHSEAEGDSGTRRRSLSDVLPNDAHACWSGKGIFGQVRGGVGARQV